MLSIVPKGIGWIEVICGSMFSGKTEELIRRIRRAQIAKMRVKIFKPVIDNRYSIDHIVSHDDQRVPSVAVKTAQEIMKQSNDADVIGIDEAQFFDLDLVNVCQKLADKGKRVIIAGLDQDYMGQPFEPIPQLLAVAEYITKTLAICMKCGNPANRTQRLSHDTNRVIVGTHDIYEARCRVCHTIPQEEKGSN